MKRTIGIIGGCFVGKSVANGFAQYADVKIYDIDSKKATNSFEEIISSDFVFYVYQRL